MRHAYALYILFGVASAATAACSSASEPAPVHGTAIDHGRDLFHDRATSSSASNAFSCATCHAAESADPAGTARVLPGGMLAGATLRTTFWGGQENDLLRSINDCRLFFMDAARPWTSDDEDARAIYAYLASLASAGGAPIAFTRVDAIVDLPAGDAAAGEAVFREACVTCHGGVHDGQGRIASFVPRLPDDVIVTHGNGARLRLVFIEKVRHGAFVSGGSMAPFSREALSDDRLAALLAYLQLY
ncbi:MAG: qcrC [Myxococcaceae bacterium]|nr:qcrC [Myxococcaceae bacterium]